MGVCQDSCGQKPDNDSFQELTFVKCFFVVAVEEFCFVFNIFGELIIQINRFLFFFLN